MLRLVRKGHDLRLDAGAIAWTDALYLPIVERRAVKCLTEYSVAGFVGVEGVAGELLESGLRSVEERELVVIVFPKLDAQLFDMQATSVNAWRRPCLHAVGTNTYLTELIGDPIGGRLGNSTSG